VIIIEGDGISNEVFDVISPRRLRARRYMARHSFIQIEKIKNVKGRINYISSHERQENLYAAMNTTNLEFWTNLAKESQTEFSKSGSEGTCIEARELIIALPEVYIQYEPQKVLELFTNSFKEKHGVECVSALHHNRKKTNYHIHLIFSERKLLEKPQVKIATRNMFYNEQGKHVRTKKEILDAESNIREGCRVIAKGEIYEQRLFTNKEAYFKSDKFLKDEKKRYTKLINRYIKNPDERLQVFDKNSVYLPTKKIGKNNPKTAEIQADNEVRTQWNQTVDMALIEGLSEQEVLKVKKEEISQKIWSSIQVNGKKPSLFRRIVLMAKSVLERVIQKFKMPPKPILMVDIEEFQQMQRIYDELLKQTKEQLSEIVLRYGYESTQDFIQIYHKSEDIVLQYQQDLKKWKEQASGSPPEKVSIREKLRQFQSEKQIIRQESPKRNRQERGAR